MTASLMLAAALLAPAADLKVGPTDWPQWRGPNRDGVSPQTGLLREWPKDGPKKLWTVQNMGLGFGTPSVAGGMIFGLGTREKKDGVWALNEADGKELWFTPFDAPRQTNQNNGPSGTPTVADGKVYAVSSLGKLVCLDATTGKTGWQVDFVKDFGGKVQIWGYTESPLVDGDTVICAPGSAKAAVVALKASTGEELWRTPVAAPGDGQGYSSAVKMKVGDTDTYVVMLGRKGGVIGVEAKTGKLLWQYDKAANGTANIPTPVVRGDLVWISTGYPPAGGSALLRIAKTGDAFEAKELKFYKGPELQNHHGNMVLVGDHVYFGRDQNQGRPTCVDFKTGEVAWMEKQGAAGGNGSAAVSAADGMLIFNYQNGKVVLVAADPKKLDVKGSFDLPQKSGKENWAHPVIANGKLFLRDQDKLHCYQIVKSGT